MLDILSITGVIFVLMAVGYLSVVLGVFTSSEMATLGKFVVNLALPALIFRAVSSRPVNEIANIGYLGAVLIGSIGVFALGFAWSRRVEGKTATVSTFRAMGMSCANSGFVGYPVLLMALPAVASTALALNMIVENLVMIPLVLAMAERAQSGSVSGYRLVAAIARRLARNPILIALALGLGVSVSGLTLPTVIARPVDVLAASSAALSLAAIGGTLAALPLRDLDRSMLATCFGKLVLHPIAILVGLIVMAALGFRVGDPELAAAAVIMAATPPMGIYPILAQQYGEERSAAAAMFVTTAMSFVTISVVLALTIR